MNPFNKFNKVLKPIALSNTCFYERILGKYRKNKIINSGFPILLFYKGRNHEGLQKIDFNVRLFLELQNSFSCVLKGLEKRVRNSTDTGKRTFILQPGKTVLNLKVLQMEDTKRVQDEGDGKCKGRYFPIREKLMGRKTADPGVSASGIDGAVGYRGKELFLSKKSTSISSSVPLSSSHFRMGISGRKVFNEFERVIPPVKLASSSAKKLLISVEKTVPVLEGSEGSVNGLSFPMLSTPVLDTIGPVLKTAAPAILSDLKTEIYGVEGRSVKKLPESELLLKKMKLFNANEFFPKKISRNREVINSTLPPLKVYPALENHYRSDYYPAEGSVLSEVNPPHSGKNELFPPTAEDLYFFNQSQIGQEIQKIKETISGMEKSVSEKLINASLPEKMSTKSDQEISIISEHVYQNIERRIRMEREMRGL